MKNLALTILICILSFCTTEIVDQNESNDKIDPTQLRFNLMMLSHFNNYTDNYDSTIGYAFDLDIQYIGKSFDISSIKICFNDTSVFDSSMFPNLDITTLHDTSNMLMLNPRDSIYGYIEHDAFGKIHFSGRIPDLIDEVMLDPEFDTLKINKNSTYTFNWDLIENGDVHLAYAFNNFFDNDAFYYSFGDSIASFTIPQDHFIDSTGSLSKYFYFNLYSYSISEIEDIADSSFFEIITTKRGVPYSNKWATN